MSFSSNEFGFGRNINFFFSLQNSGIQFEKHEQEGIDPIHFAEIMLVSGLVLREPVKWLSFHSGYDFGYLLNLLTNQNLPKTESEFFELLKLYFPNVYDVKYLMKSCKNLKGGLQVRIVVSNCFLKEIRILDYFNPNWHEAGWIYPPYNFWIGFCQLNFYQKVFKHFWR